MKAAFHSLLRATESGWDYQNSDEAIIESCEANGYEFLENGELA
jgi:hypothetical protein